MASIQKYETKKGTLYRAIVYAGIDPETGKQINIQKRGFKTKRAANAWADRQRVEIQRDGIKRSPEKMTFSELCKEWLPLYQTTVKPNTYIKTKGYFDNHLLPTLKDYPLTKVTPSKVTQLVNDLHGKLHHFRQVYQYLNRCMAYAVKQGYLNVNPCADIIIPKQHKQPAPDIEPFWNKEELSAFLAACKKDTRPIVYPLFRLLAYTGLRRGELLALEWSDINFTNNTLTVRQALTKDLSKRITIGTPKNASSARTIPLDTGTIGALTAWKKFSGGRFIFESSKGKPLSESLPRKWLGQVCERIELRPINIHGLRHTHCSLLFESGATPKEVQDRLGHSSAEMTLNIYTHLSRAKKKDVPEKFAKFMQF